ncbi:hypothetical protein V6R21_01515 [Limibacter armeniacum]|uniref:hypothetical protein n=1 Tax=Limibacter armeniacum TaxID=466084 RepID=UPI002FE6AEE3
MKSENDWREQVLNSMKDSQRAQPNKALFGKIESRWNAMQQPVSSSELRRMMVAAALVISLNVWGILHFTQKQGNQERVSPYEQTTLISNYNLYE